MHDGGPGRHRAIETATTRSCGGRGSATISGCRTCLAAPAPRQPQFTAVGAIVGLLDGESAGAVGAFEHDAAHQVDAASRRNDETLGVDRETGHLVDRHPSAGRERGLGRGPCCGRDDAELLVGHAVSRPVPRRRRCVPCVRLTADRSSCAAAGQAEQKAEREQTRRRAGAEQGRRNRRTRRALPLATRATPRPQSPSRPRHVQHLRFVSLGLAREPVVARCPPTGPEAVMDRLEPARAAAARCTAVAGAACARRRGGRWSDRPTWTRAWSCPPCPSVRRHRCARSG